MTITQQFVVIVPAAGIGKRMQANRPKQYLHLKNKTILTHTLTKLLSHPRIHKVILPLSEGDQYFAESDFANHPNVIRVNGGKERVDSVLNGLHALDYQSNPWVLVHDAARPCITHQDIDKLIASCIENDCGSILASPVRDTMKRGSTFVSKQKTSNDLSQVKMTIEREQLWHALTPQMFKSAELTFAIEQALAKSLIITDESSAMEQAGFKSLLVTGSSENIKITHPDDLALAEFYLNRQFK